MFYAECWNISAKIPSRTGIPCFLSFLTPKSAVNPVFYVCRAATPWCPGWGRQISGILSKFWWKYRYCVHYRRFWFAQKLFCILLDPPNFYLFVIQNICNPITLNMYSYKLLFFCLGFVWCKQRLCWGIWCPWLRAIRQLRGK